jgi:hypothetical protein
MSSNAAHVDEIKALFDVEDFLSSRWVGNHLKISMKSAQELLSSVKQQNASLIATYVVSGRRLGQKGSSFVTVAERNLEKVKSEFEEQPSISIYSLQKASTASVDVQLTSKDTDQAIDCLQSQETESHFLKNEIGGIKLSSTAIAKVGKRMIAARAASAPVRDSSNTSSAGTTSKILGSSSSKSVVDSQKKASKAPAIVANFFGKSSETSKSTENKTKSAAGADKKGSDKSAEKESESTTNAKKADADDDLNDDAEWDDGDGYKTQKSKLKEIAKEEDKRRRKYIAADDEEEDEEDKVSDENKDSVGNSQQAGDSAAGTEDGPKKKGRKRKEKDPDGEHRLMRMLSSYATSSAHST